MPISGSSYYDDNKERGEKKKPFFRAYLDALKAGKRVLDEAVAETPDPSVSAPYQAQPVPIAPPVTYAPPAASAPPVTAPQAAAPIPAVVPQEAYAAPTPAVSARAPRRPAKRRRSSSEPTEMAGTTSASMDIMMQHILELAQKVEAAASKVEAVADKADASARPSAEDGALVTARPNFSRPTSQSFGAHTGSADPAEAPFVPPVVSDPGMRPSAPMAPASPRGVAPEAIARDAATSGMVILEDEMAIPKVAPFILEQAKSAPAQPIPELRKVDNAPDLHLTKTQDEPRAQGAPIVLRSPKKDSRAVND